MDRDEALDVLRRSQDRVLESEGIPMVLALVTEGGPTPPAAQPGVRAEGQRLAETMDAFRDALLPGSRNDDLGAVISVLQAVSYRDINTDAAGHVRGAGSTLDEADVELPSRRVGT